MLLWRPVADSAGAESSEKKQRSTQQYLQKLQVERFGFSLVIPLLGRILGLLDAQTLSLRRSPGYCPVSQFWGRSTRLVRGEQFNRNRLLSPFFELRPYLGQRTEFRLAADENRDFPFQGAGVAGRAHIFHWFVFFFVNLLLFQGQAQSIAK
jgi:hypothetical protein